MKEFSVDEALLFWVYTNLPPGSTILELGAGESTNQFKAHGYNVISIEHDLKFIGLVPGVDYIHAEIEEYNDKYDLPPSFKKNITNTQTGWYNREQIKQGLTKKNYDLILVDGPPRTIGRTGFAANFTLFNRNAIIIFDDVHRKDELYMARRIANEVGKDLLITNNGYTIVGQKKNGDLKAEEKKPFGVIW